MKIKPVTQCKTKWEIQKNRKWPRWYLPVVWNDILIAGTLEGHDKIIDVTEDGDWGDAVIGCYESLSLYDLARLRDCSEGSQATASFILSRVVRHFGHHWSSDLPRCMEWVSSAPPTIRDWAERKQLSLTDLRPMLSLPEGDPGLSFIEKAIQIFQPAHNDGSQLIEWCVDLSLLGRLNEVVADDWKSCKTLIAKLKSLRFPRAQVADQDLFERVEKVNWPKQTVVRSFRQGDRTAVELKITANSLNDLRARLESLRDSAEKF